LEGTGLLCGAREVSASERVSEEMSLSRSGGIQRQQSESGFSDKAASNELNLDLENGKRPCCVF
ncbi:unnamed protein product, partial [Arabidopsis halleri]